MKEKFKIGNVVAIDECYLTDEVTESFRNEISPTAIVCSEPSDDEELVAIEYESKLIDFVPQNILKIINND